MPELPDVEGFRRVAENAAGRRVAGVDVIDAAVLRNTTGGHLARMLVGQRFERPHRQGKWLVLGFGGCSVLIHFGMTGMLVWLTDGGRGQHRHDRVVFTAEGGRLVYRDQRKLQGLWLAEEPGGIDEIVGEQGPDALGLQWRAFDRAMQGRRGSLKAALMDQAVVAGLGNMLSDEILWRAKVHPAERWPELGAQQRRALHRAIRSVAATSASHGRVPARRDWLSSQREETVPVCPRCGRDLRRERRAGRTSLWCPTCQPVPGG